LERGTAPREDADRLRRHLDECEACRAGAEQHRNLAASLESLAERSRADLSDEAVESLYRRARVHGWLGRPMRQPIGLRVQRKRWLPWVVPLAVAAAAAVLVIVGLHPPVPGVIKPAGALDRLAREAERTASVQELAPLAALARAAIGEELARPAPNADRVADLVLVSFITQRPREARQARDVRFLVEGVLAQRGESAGRFAPGAPGVASASRRDARAEPGPLGCSFLASTAVPPLSLSEAAEGLSDAKALVLAGAYEEALAAMHADDRDVALRVWCLQMLGWSAEAAHVLAGAEEPPPDAMARALRVDLALQSRNVAEAIRQYEALADENDRYWFAAGYLTRYALGDAHGAGLRFKRVKDPRLASYVAREFGMELAAAEIRPLRLVAEDFEGYGVGTPAEWALVRARGGEFHIVDVPGGKALRQNEVDLAGAELLTGGPSWGNYTLQVDVKVEVSRGDYAIGAVACRSADDSGYVLELSPRRLRLVKQFAATEERGGPAGPRRERLLLEPFQAVMHLDEPPAQGWWYTLKIRVQQMDDGVSVAGKVWRTDTDEPLGWQVTWTDTGQAGCPVLLSGLAGLQISGARVLVDNLVILKEEAP
jgi:tetratricopeptide (TPR) repeat protein